MRRGTTSCLAVSVALALSAVSGCVSAPRPSAPGSVAPGPREVEGEGRDAVQGVGTYKRDLRRLKAERLEMSATGEAGFSVCEDLCGLMTDTCSIKDKLCDLAEAHKGEDSYQGLCREAKLDCTEAQDSCEQCTKQAYEQSEAQPE